MNARFRLVWFRRLARLGTALALVVVVVGAWVRLTDAGLGCPDWPGCYGHVSPAIVAEHAAEASAAFPGRPFDYQKALHEMVHRYIAGTLGLVIIGLALFSVWNRREPGQPRVLPWLLLAVVCAQGALGAFTVTLLLKPLIVTLHLAGGLMTLGTLWWLSLAPDVRSVRAVELPVRQLAGVALVVVAMQVVLGGWTSSNYAGVACPDFPRCQGQWLPATDAAAAFTLAHGPGVDFEHGVLDQPARAAIHLAHRAGAVITALMLLLLATMARSRVPAPRVRAWSLTLAGAIVLQWVIGINLIWRGFPLWLGTAHNFGAAAVLLSTLGLVRALHPRSGGVAVNVLPSHRY